MTTNIKSDLMSSVTDSITLKMETCGASWLKSWVGNSSLPVNCENGKQYNGINLFILLGEEMSSGKWGTYKAWDRLGKQISKGQHGTKIIYFKSVKSKTEVNPNGTSKFYPMMRTYTIFNESQTDGYEINIEGDGQTFAQADADQWIKKSKAVIDYKNTSAFYNPTKDKIGMPPMKSFFKTDDATAEQNFYGTLFHELTHWTGHTTRENRLIKKSSREDYAFEELVAELGACFQSVQFGIEPMEVNADHTKYLNGWLKALKNDKSLIFKAAAKANQAIQFLNGLQVEVKKVA